MGRSVASLDCHIELRKAQPWHEGAAWTCPFPSCASGSSGAGQPQPHPALSHFPSHLPWAAQGAQSSLCRLWEQLGTPAQVSPARAVSPPCAHWRKLCPRLGTAGPELSLGDHPGGKQFQGTGGTSRTRQKSLTRTRLTLHEPQPDLPQRIQVWSLGYTARWLKGDSNIRTSSFCFKERHSKRYMR